MQASYAFFAAAASAHAFSAAFSAASFAAFSAAFASATALSRPGVLTFAASSSFCALALNSAEGGVFHWSCVCCAVWLPARYSPQALADH